jgi:hypothetical protein
MKALFKVAVGIAVLFLIAGLWPMFTTKRLTGPELAAVPSPATELTPPSKAMIKAITFITNNRNAAVPKELWKNTKKKRTKVVAYVESKDIECVSFEDLATHQIKIQHMSVKAYGAMFAVLVLDGYIEQGTIKDEYINP